MRPTTVTFLVLTIAISLSAQPREGKTKELSLSGGFQSYSREGSSESSHVILLSPRLGFYLIKGLEIEPELLLMITSAADPVQMVNGNVSYNFISDSKGIPFLLAGYGIANTVPFFNVPTTRTNFRVDVLNLGGGMKTFLVEDVAFRLEYRYQRFFGQGPTIDYIGYSYSEKVDSRLHSVQIGLSIML